MNIGSNIVGRRSTPVFIQTATGSPQTQIAGVPGFIIRVLGWFLQGSNAASILTLADSVPTAGLGANGPGASSWSVPVVDCGQFECAAGAGLTLTAAASATVVGHIVYELVRA